MRRAGPFVAVAIVIVTNLLVLAGVARNRSGEPEALVTLTERELPVAWSSEENTGKSLRLDPMGGWSYRGDSGQTAAWFDQAKLQSIGFDCHVPPEDPKAEVFYDRALARRTYAALEHDGSAWQRWIEHQEARLTELAGRLDRAEATETELESARKALEEERRTASRLFVIDVGNDPEALRRAHPDRTRVMILPAEARLLHENVTVEGTKQQAWILRGWIDEILTNTVHLPLPYHAAFASLPQLSSEGQLMSDGRYDDEPRYEIDLAIGRRHEPWIKAMRPLRQQGVQPVPGQRRKSRGIAPGP